MPYLAQVFKEYTDKVDHLVERQSNTFDDIPNNIPQIPSNVNIPPNMNVPPNMINNNGGGNMMPPNFNNFGFN